MVYSVLTARLRAAVQESTDSDCSWPLFQPLRKRRTAFVDAVVRDLGCPLIDPMEGSDQLGCPVPEPPSVLPSPEKGPRKRRCGMVFTLPAVYNLLDGLFCQILFSLLFPIDLARFVDQDLGSMVTQALAIPLTSELPTPNSRKTCALAIWLLQTQRLPADVLVPAKDRITYAFRRAVEGELGKRVRDQ